MLTPRLNIATLAAFVWLGATAVAGSNEIPTNIDSILRHMIDQKEGRLPKTIRKPTDAQFDSDGRILVMAYLDGTAEMAVVEKAVDEIDGSVTDRAPQYRYGALAFHIPVSNLPAASHIPGIRAITISLRPQRYVGAATSEGTVVHRSDRVDTEVGLRGDGVTVGVLSDSFDRYAFPPHAADDVASGDLPVVSVLQDQSGTDEGRAMLQVIYDVAPHTNLAFATASLSIAGFANNIRRLRTEALCDVIVDDIGFPQEPLFSEGLVAQAVEDVVNSSILPGKRVVYCSSAANDGNNGYRATFRSLDDAAVRSPGGHGNLQLDSVDPALTAGGWHNWNTDSLGPTEPTTTITIGKGYFNVPPSTITALLALQWDDPFDLANGLTTDFNLLVFDADGNFLTGLSGDTNNFQVQQPLEISGDLQGGVPYQIAITRTTQTNGSPQLATHLALYTNLNTRGTMRGKYFDPNTLSTPSTHGHNATASAITVGAYDFDWTGQLPYRPMVADYTSPGPTTIYFDATGNRLPKPVILEKPEIAGVDGISTTLGYFFGTSAAAPHLAGIAALLIQAGGGPGAISPAQIKQAIEQTAGLHDGTLLFCQAIAESGQEAPTQAPRLTVTGRGEAFLNPDYITVAFSGLEGQSVQDLTIDVTTIGLTWNLNPAPPEPPYALGTLIGLTPGDITLVTTGSGPTLAFTFAPDSFTGGDSFSFTASVRSTNPNGVGDAADFLDGATVLAQLSGGGELVGTFSNDKVIGYRPTDGYGVADAYAAAQFVLSLPTPTPTASPTPPPTPTETPSPSPTPKSTPSPSPSPTLTPLPSPDSHLANLSTRMRIETGDNVLIAGFIVHGTAQKRLLLRGIGPSLPVPGALSDPTLELHDSAGNLIVSNDNWMDNANAGKIIATGIAPQNPLDSALLVSFQPNSYTVILQGKAGATGIGLVEVYDLDQGAQSEVANISTRGFIQTGDDVMIAGLILTGTDPATVVLRGIGPSLPLSNPLTDPFLELHNASGDIIFTNDNWRDTQETEIQATGLAPTNDFESAILISLTAGNYTAIVKGADGGIGNGLVEAYRLSQ